MAHDEFRRALTRLYLENPCQVLPNPLRTTLDQLDAYETAFAAAGDDISRLEAWDGDHLHVYWRRSGRQPSLLINRRLEYQRSAMIHQDFLDAPTVAGFSHFDSSYRLICRQQPPATPGLPTGFRLAGVVNSPDEVEAMAAHIAQNDDVHNLTAFQDWLNSPVFASDLWLWVIDETADEPVGLGIGDLDPAHSEASILWLQVLPEHQGKGIGRAIVHELLRRMADRAVFTTVSGPVEDRDNPGAFFRRCGFTGDDVWWHLKRE